MASRSSKGIAADRRQDAGPGEPVDIWIYSAFHKEHWLARKPGDLTRSDHPGTAVQIGDDLFEVLTAQETAEPGYTVRYGLKRWDPQHVVRRAVAYTPETQSRSAAEFLEEHHGRALRGRILWFFPFAGLAPDPLQREWQKRTGLNMTVVSAASAVATVVFWMGLVQTFGRSLTDQNWFYLIDFLGIEGIFRFVWIVFSGKPHGTGILTLPYIFWEAIARPAKRRQRQEDRWQSAFVQDEVMRRPETGHLTIRSVLFDPMLVGPQPILFEGTVYRPLHWQEEEKGIRRRFVYEFGKIEADVKGNYREYGTPRPPAWQKAAEAFTRNRDRVQIFALLWGTFPRREQLRLEAKYHFAAAKWTGVTAGFLLACGLLQIWATILAHATIIALVGPVYLVCESLYRLYVSKLHGLPAASLAGICLGLLLRPPQ